jgi:hypothetical protein
MSNLSFLKWISLLEADLVIPSIETGLEVFKSPINQTQISAATIIDGELTKFHYPFIYLGSEDEVFIGESASYHHNLIDGQEDFSISSKLSNAYYGIARGQSSDNAVGRIGFKTDFAKLKRNVPNDNLKKFLFGTTQTVSFVDFTLEMANRPSYETRKIFDEIDIIAIYDCTIEIAARAVKKLQEKDKIRDPLKTVIAFEKKCFDFNELVAHQKDPAAAQPVAATAQDTKKEPASFFPKDFKPKTWKDARKWAGLPPTIGDWNTNHQ